MKQNFGIPLSRNEMKAISGGLKGQLICTCGNTMITTACAFNSFSQSLNCWHMAIQYCGSIGYSSTSCNGAAQ